MDGFRRQPITASGAIVMALRGLIINQWSLLSFLLHVACLLVTTSADAPALSSYAKSLQLDAKYELYWTADTSASKPKINFAVHAQTKGYVGFGISEAGGMVGTGERE